MDPGKCGGFPMHGNFLPLLYGIAIMRTQNLKVIVDPCVLFELGELQGQAFWCQMLVALRLW